jgi:peptidoglycan hydrolase-like protein with peptidoglycan-binding domain
MATEAPQLRRRILHGAIANEDVRLAQLALREAGFDPGEIDGVYGFHTARAVREFQLAKGLTANGVIDPMTWRALADEPAGEKLKGRTLTGTLHGAVSGSDVERAQVALREAGFDPGEIDGVYGFHTARAVREFQRKARLPVDGVIRAGTQTWRMLLGESDADIPGSVDDRTGSAQLGEPNADISGSVEDLRRRLQGSVTAYVLVAEVLSGHSDYGGNTASSVEVGDAPEGADTQTVDGWIKKVRPLFVPQDPGKLDDRKLTYGLALLDQELRRRLSEHGFLAALGREIVVRGQLSGRGKALRKADAVPTLSDQPAEVDLLGRKALAEALGERLRDEFRRTKGAQSQPDSFMLHLEGPWGSGKTSLLGFLKGELKTPKPRPGEKTPEPWLVVDFNSWQNQRAGAPWWLLISAVLREAVRDKHTDVRLRLRLRVRALWWRLQLAKAEIAVVALALAILGLLVWTGSLKGSDPIGILAGTVSSVVAAVSGLHGLMSSVAGGSERGAQTFIRQTRDPMNTLKRRFNRLVDDIGRPIVILIDDLDRCRADYVVDLLEGVQTIFRDAPVAFVVAADRHWLYDAYAQIYGDYVKMGVDPGRPLGHLFLEKTFQLSTSVPKISSHDQRMFWERLLSPPEDGEQLDHQEFARKAEQDFAGLNTEPAILGELDHNPGETPEENRVRREAAVRRLASPTLQQHIEHTLTPLAPLLEPNPRAMKRLVNAYGVERAVQILEGRSAEFQHPRERLALWTILKSRWPLLSDYLSEHPNALDDLKASHVPEAVVADGDRPYLRRLFEDPAAQRVARGEGLDGVELDPASLRFLIEGPGQEPVYG